ncbi:MAG TPA: hypothetical protein VGS79_13575 [Puia sp.]|nr:hypothetical protein [Puia sp.]
MERLKELIIQLKEQFDRKAEPSQMLETAKLLEAELQLLASQPAPAKVMPTKIAVMMPSASKIYAPAAQTYAQPAAPQTPAPEQHHEPIPEPHREPAPEPRREPTPEPRREPAVSREPATQRNGVASGAPGLNGTNGAAIPAAGMAGTPAVGFVAPTSGEPEAPEETIIKIEKAPERGQWPFDPLAEKPTDRFTLSQRAREVNDVIGSSGTSLNDKLKSEVADLKSALNDTPVRDLKKAIGVNDRYVFINQLFRGDEVMYERSLKTINGFRILPEAEYWMERELKVKLGWDENREATRHFYQLVKRRFS